MGMRARWRSFEIPTRVAVEKGSLTKTYGKFIAEPFERGFGITIGNSIRRVLLSSLEGSAVTSIKIDGVQHEFSAIPGVVDDVTDIVLNVKQLLVKVRTEEPRKIKIDVKKKGAITGYDIQADAMVEIVNPELPICTLSEERSFRMELEVRKGRGYVTAEENDSEDREIGVIPIDSIFSPVHRVRYKTENTRVGQLTDYDKLILEVWTNGVVSPEMALTEASKVLRKHLIPFVNYFELGEELEPEAYEEEETQPMPAVSLLSDDGEVGGPGSEGDGEGAEGGEGGRGPVVAARAGASIAEIAAKPIGDLSLSVRAQNCLEAENIQTVGELVGKGEEELLKLRNFGKTSLKEVKKKLSDLGLALGMDVASAGKK